jgi:hypothetical protein
MSLLGLSAALLLASQAVALPQSPPAGNPSVQCAPKVNPYPTWQQLPKQASLPDPFLPLKYMTLDNAGGSEAQFTQDVMTGKGKNRIKTKEEWYQCQRPQLLEMLQEYQFGYYPDHSKEKVEATRSGNSLSISVTAEGKTGKFTATLNLPTGTGPFPVVINIGGMQNAPYLQAGIAIAGFDYSRVAADSNSKTGAFWDIYKGRDIGMYSFIPSYWVWRST